MRNFISETASAVGTAIFLLAFLIAHSAYAGADIQMLPPVGFDNSTACGGTGAGVGVLYWDGATPIHCVPGFLGNSVGDVFVTGDGVAGNGNLSIGSALKIGGAGPLTNTSANILLGIQNVGDCYSNNEGLSIDANHNIHCTAPLSGTTAPTPSSTCNGANQALQWDGTNYSCVTISPSGGAACGSTPNGYILTTFTSDYCAGGASSDDWGWTTITQCQNGSNVAVSAPIHTGYCPH